MSSRKRGLGKGLDSLLSTSSDARHRQVSEDVRANQTQHIVNDNSGELRKIPIEWLTPGKYQPRRDMSAEALEELASSIEAQGVIQPIVVRTIGSQRYEIIAGERRWRAAQQIHLHEIPCIIKNVADEAAVAIALIENIQREDLNAMEEAVALQRLLQEFELTHQQVADAVGKSRTAISNLLRLNGLTEEVKRLLEHGDIDMGHARALLALEGDQQIDLARSVAAKGLTVRDTEKLVKKYLTPPSDTKLTVADPDVTRLEQHLSERLSAGVKIQSNKKGQGKLVISYASLDELEQIVKHIADQD
jgi:ParB family chromosome partitioning protein